MHVLCSEDEAVLVRALYLLTMKPMIYAANVAEGDMADRGGSSSFVQALKVKADEDNCEVVVISAQVGYSEVIMYSECVLSFGVGQAVILSAQAAMLSPLCSPPAFGPLVVLL